MAVLVVPMAVCWPSTDHTVHTVWVCVWGLHYRLLHWPGILPPLHHSACLPLCMLLCMQWLQVSILSVFPCTVSAPAIPSCELCGKGFSTFSWIFCGTGHSHRKTCLARHRAEYDAFPPSSLYKCSTCQKRLKVWPSSKLDESRCGFCDEEIINDDTNMHVCFPCAGKGPMNQNHLCNRHSLSQGRALTLVNWKDKDSGNFFKPVDEDDGLGDAGGGTADTVNEGTINIDPPGYEEATKFPTVSNWDDYRGNKTSKIIRQYSSGFKRMVSSSGSDAAEDLEAHNMLSYPRQPPTNPDIQR